MNDWNSFVDNLVWIEKVSDEIIVDWGNANAKEN
tara:strand:- start:694 stop:795 length:102 start_codon:yes stop_codon:yes gene_type:complete